MLSGVPSPRLDNIPGKAHAVLLYANTAPAYRAKLAETAAKGYEGFELR